MKPKCILSNNIIKLEDYKIGRYLGEGGFGIVFEATEKKTGQKVAIKFLKEKELLYNKNHQKCFMRELFIPSLLQIPGIVKLVGYRYPLIDEEITNEKQTKLKVTKKNGESFILDLTSGIIISELMPNGSIKGITRQYLESEGVGFEDRMNPTIRTKTIYGVASTMRKIHRRKTVHRDLKLENVFLDENFEQKIADFGISKIIDDVNMTMGIGSPIYMAPELFIETDVKYGLPVDVYAFAMFVYKMFSNTVKFKNNKIIKSSQQFFMKIGRGERPVRPKNIPDCYWSLINNCWKQDPSQRLTFDEIIELLRDDKFAINEFGMKTDLDDLHEYQKRCDADIDEIIETKIKIHPKIDGRKRQFIWDRH